MKNNECYAYLQCTYIYNKHIKLVYTHMIFCASERTFIYPEADS